MSAFAELLLSDFYGEYIVVATDLGYAAYYSGMLCLSISIQEATSE